MTAYALGDLTPDLDPDAWIAPGAHVIGRVRLEAHAAVWFGATLRGDNEPIVVGQGTNIQENCVLHTDIGYPLTIGANCTIGHKAMLHGCTLGDTCLIGMSATVLNGARIGAHSLIGAGALVTEGKEIPECVLVLGSPGKVVRDLTEAEIAGLTASAQHYQERARLFRADLRPL